MAGFAQWMLITHVFPNYWAHILSILICGGVTGVCLLHWLYGIAFRSKQFTINHNINSKSSSNNNLFPHKFRILSQNTWCLPLVGGSKRKQRLELFINKIKISQPDIICLQEIFLFSLFGFFIICVKDIQFLNNKLYKIGYIYRSNPKKSLPKWFGFNSGLMLYSKISFKISSIFNYNSKYLSFPKSVVNRGFIYSIFDINDEDSLLVINTHLENKIREAKLLAIDELSNYLLNNLNCINIKYVVCLGDFNICSNWTWELNINKQDRLYSILSNIFQNKCKLTYDLFNGYKRSYRVTKYDPNAIYDHMFVNDNLKKININHQIKDWQQNGLIMSDHYALMAEFDLNILDTTQ